MQFLNVIHTKRGGLATPIVGETGLRKKRVCRNIPPIDRVRQIQIDRKHVEECSWMLHSMCQATCQAAFSFAKTHSPSPREHAGKDFGREVNNSPAREQLLLGQLQSIQRI
ncbi:hypothetical protein RB195_015052 [Necator americanus]|uniref:Uncharacterized protein n=1 Tax=Necator americanus TaxID=51031 RepID=A0ABR1E2Y8_NECAM